MATEEKVKVITDKNFDETIRNNSMIIIDCWAAWCGPCRMLSPIVEELAGQYYGKVFFGKLNVDENTITPRKFGIMSIPTLLIFKEGKLIDTVVGAVPKSVLEDKIHILI